MRRNRYDIYYDMILTAQVQSKKMEIMYGAMINNQSGQKRFREIIQKGLIVEALPTIPTRLKRFKYYIATGKGDHYLETMEELRRLLK